MPKQKWTGQNRILLAENLTVVSKMSQPFWFAGKLIIRVRLQEKQSSCTCVMYASTYTGHQGLLSQIDHNTATLPQWEGRLVN